MLSAAIVSLFQTFPQVLQWRKPLRADPFASLPALRLRSPQQGQSCEVMCSLV